MSGGSDRKTQHGGDPSASPGNRQCSDALIYLRVSFGGSPEYCAQGENGDRVIALSDIKEDAKKVRPYDHVWDMYSMWC